MGGGAVDQGARYLLREKLLSIGDDFWIENDQGERIFYVDSKVLRVRDTVLIKDRAGNELVKLQKRLLRARNTMAIERGSDTVARVKKAIIAPLRDRFTIELAGGGSPGSAGQHPGSRVPDHARRHPGGQHLQALDPGPRKLRRGRRARPGRRAHSGHHGLHRPPHRLGCAWPSVLQAAPSRHRAGGRGAGGAGALLG